MAAHFVRAGRPNFFADAEVSVDYIFTSPAVFKKLFDILDLLADLLNLGLELDALV